MNNPKKVLIVDDTFFCVSRLETVLEKEGWKQIESVLVDDLNRGEFEVSSLEEPLFLAEKVAATDLVVCDFDFGNGAYSLPWLLAVRRQYPQLPVILFTGNSKWSLPRERDKGKDPFDISSVGIEFADKGGWFNKEIFPRAGCRKIKGSEPQGDFDPYWVIGGEKVFPGDPRLEERMPALWSDLEATPAKEEDLLKMWEIFKGWSPEPKRMRKCRISSLKRMSVFADPEVNEIWEEGGELLYDLRKHKGSITHEIGHALCDGDLSPEDVAPYLPLLKRFLERPEMKKYVESDYRFGPCSEFILEGRPASHLPMLLRRY